MTRDPIPSISDQRYFHVALMSASKPEFGVSWLWDALRKDSKILQGRYKRNLGFEFKTAEESSIYAGSPTAKQALASDKPNVCVYDVFGGSVGDLVVIGSGYAALTGLLVNRLIKRGLREKAQFLAPKLKEIVDSCRVGQDSTLPVKYTITGFNAFVPGVKKLRGLNLSGSDVFGSGLVDQIEHWLNTRGAEEAGLKDSMPARSELHQLQYQGIRLKSTGALSGAAVSVTLEKDGACKMWLRKNAANLIDFGIALSTLQELDRFVRTAEAPSYIEKTES